MTTYVHRTMILPAAYTPLAQSLAVGLAGSAGAGMWTTGLSPTGSAPATHYVSSGMIEDTFADLIVDANAMYAACQAVGAGVTLSQCQALVSQSLISYGDNPQSAFEAAGLKVVSNVA